MLYKVIGIMSGSSLDGLDIVYAHLQETAGKWVYEIMYTDCYAYSNEWINKLQRATDLHAKEYLVLHTEYGHFIGQQVNRFLEENSLHFQVQLIASHGHTTFHEPKKRMTAQLGDGASIAAETNINVISDLRSMDLALGGQGAPIVPIGEKLLLNEYDFFLNLGGIANISANSSILQNKQMDNDDKIDFVAFDICPANRVLNMLAREEGKFFDEDGKLARIGKVDTALLERLNVFGFYKEKYPKSLANDFGTNEVYPLIKKAGCSVPDALRTYAEHIAIQVSNAIGLLISDFKPGERSFKLLATGGGVHNLFLVERLKQLLIPLQVELIVPDNQLADYKEALIMALIGVLRWREEVNALSSVTGATRNSIGGAVWIGQEV